MGGRGSETLRSRRNSSQNPVHPQLRKGLFIVASPTSSHSVFAKIPKVTKGSSLHVSVLPGPTCPSHIEEVIQMLSGGPVCSNTFHPQILKPGGQLTQKVVLK